MNKQYSLKKNYDIQKIFLKKQSVGNSFFAIYYDFYNDIEVAISISKKLGKAHERNYNKRVVREILRKNMTLLENKHMLIVIKEKSLKLVYEEKEREIIKLLKRIR